MDYLKNIFCLLLVLLSTQVFARKGVRFDVDYPAGEIETKSSNLAEQSAQSFKTIELIRSAKFLIINGELEKAKILLREAPLTSDFSRQTQLRYLSMIHFIEGNYKETFKILQKPDMQRLSLKGRYCVMNLITLLLLDEVKTLKSEYNICLESISNQAEQNLVWLDTLIRIKLEGRSFKADQIFKDVVLENLSPDQLRIYLKLAIYLNQQKQIIPKFKIFNKETLSDPLYRELIGMNYFRNFDLVKAYKILESSNDPNAEVFKGNLLLLQKKYDAAFAQYKLALKQKSNSMNALERLIPLSWKLEQWQEGINYISSFKFSKQERLKKLTLLAAFQTMQDEPKKVETTLKRIDKLTKTANPHEILQISSLNALLRQDERNLEDRVYKTCLRKDGLHCWMLYAISMWDEPSEKLKSKARLHKGSLKEYDSYLKGIKKTPLDEEVFVKQKEIEELDNEIIELLSLGS